MVDSGVQKAVTAAGSRAALARGLKVTRAAISLWPRVPSARVIAVENLTGVPRHELRPDLYPPPRRAHPRRKEAARAAS
jgi:DNA-binding transcriptional regulator YdaS (Cro superfamily)